MESSPSQPAYQVQVPAQLKKRGLHLEVCWISFAISSLLGRTNGWINYFIAVLE